MMVSIYFLYCLLGVYCERGVM